jgi:23S rRNA (cytosine1962-C5)-methyltransferase
VSDLQFAWSWRESRGIFDESEAVRVFHGPGESRGALASFAVDRFASHYWITQWEGGSPAQLNRALEQLVDFYASKNAESVVLLKRPEKGVPQEPVILFGKPPEKRIEVREGSSRFWIQLQGARHPGLFLDHLPLRRWLNARAGQWKVLNTFSYTGSLSVAAAAGHAEQVTTLDLANSAVQWAEENWKLNGFEAAKGRFISGDVFEWLPRLKREGKVFDCVILDPPSFSHGKKGSFSTSKDLPKLHSLAMDLLSPDGVLVTSINSAQVSWTKYQADVASAAQARNMSFEVLSKIDLPETFPTRLGAEADRYLKGWILRRQS